MTTLQQELHGFIVSELDYERRGPDHGRRRPDQAGHRGLARGRAARGVLRVPIRHPRGRTPISCWATSGRCATSPTSSNASRRRRGSGRRLRAAGPPPVSTLGLTVRDLWCLLRERRPGDALAVVGDIARERFYLTTEQVVVRKDMVADAGPATSAVRIEEATGDHLPLLAEFNRRQCNRRRTQTLRRRPGGRQARAARIPRRRADRVLLVARRHAYGRRLLPGALRPRARRGRHVRVRPVHRA